MHGCAHDSAHGGYWPLFDRPDLGDGRCFYTRCDRRFIYVDANTPKAKRLGVEERKAAYAVWDRLAECESGGDWSINTRNGFYGGLQFSLTSWRNVGGSGYPHQNSREEQIYRGEKVKALQGWGAWPACSRKLGLR